MAKHKADFPKKVGLALGSGAARGWAHIGVIRALAEAGVEIECVAGTSIGSLVGAALALDRMDVLEEFARRLDWRQVLSLLDVVFPRSGLIDGEKLAEVFHGHVQGAAIEDMRMPYCAVATDLGRGCERLLDAGDVVSAIRASIAVPGVFTPARRGDEFLVDGGLVNPVPVSAVRKLGAKHVIAVDLNHDFTEKKMCAPLPAESPSREVDDRPAEEKRGNGLDLPGKFKELSASTLAQARQWFRKDPMPNIFDVLTASINIMEAQITTVSLAIDPPDLLIQPRLGHIRFMDFHRADETIAEGRRETLAQLERCGFK